MVHDGPCGRPAKATWDAAFFDIWDTISPQNLPSMHRLHRRFARRCGRMWSWERAECEAMRRRGQTAEHPGCFVSETGYTIGDEHHEFGGEASPEAEWAAALE